MNGEAMAAFMEGFQRTKALMDQQRLQRDELGMRRQDRQQVLTRQSEQDRIAAEDRARQATERERALALQGMQVPGNLAELGGTASDPGEAQRLIESMMPAVLKAFGPDALAYGQPAVEMATRTITARQKKDVERFVEQALKTSFIADNPDADPEITSLPEHIQRAVGKPSAKLSELQQFASLPVGKPAKPQEKPAPFNLSPGQTRFSGSGEPIATLPDRPRVPRDEPLMQVSEIDPTTGEIVTKLVPRQAGEVSRKPPTTAKTTESERKAAAFHRQMESAITLIDALEDKLTDAELYQIQSLPQEDLIGLINRGKLSEHAKRYLRAFEQFTEARLRPVSGAAIADSEFARDRRTYARQFGETPQLSQDRRAARQTALQSLADMAGSARQTPSGGPPPATAPTTGPKPGERRKVRGVLAEWDGQGWLPVR